MKKKWVARKAVSDGEDGLRYEVSRSLGVVVERGLEK